MVDGVVGLGADRLQRAQRPARGQAGAGHRGDRVSGLRVARHPGATTVPGAGVPAGLMLGLQLICAASADGGAVNPTATARTATAAPIRTAPVSAESTLTNHPKGPPSPPKRGQIEASAESDDGQGPGVGTMRKGGAERARSCWRAPPLWCYGRLRSRGPAGPTSRAATERCSAAPWSARWAAPMC